MAERSRPQNDQIAAEAIDAEVWKLLPWLPSDALSDGELANVCDHLKRSSLCRHELLFLSELRFAVEQTSQNDLAMPEDRFSKLMARIETYEAENETENEAAIKRLAAPVQPPSLEIGRFGKAPMVWALAAQAALVLLLAGALLQDSLFSTSLQAANPQPAFVTLSAAPTEAESSTRELRLIFEDDLTMLEMRRVLIQEHADITSGPTRFGVYTVALSIDEPLNEILQRLRSQSGVAMVEPVARP